MSTRTKTRATASILDKFESIKGPTYCYSLFDLSYNLIEMFITILCVVIYGFVSNSHALDNGVALTPPMGWLTWLRFGCIVDCEKHPDECISENLIKRTADVMASEGYLEAGYQYVTIDDCWPEMERDSDGRLVADRKRFPSGIKALSRYVQGKGLKFGIYEDYGKKTCAGYPGILHHEKTDVDTFAEWEVDYLKLDGCGSPDSDTGYPYVGKLLNETGRPIVYSCSWPAYQSNPNYSAIAKSCNIWRNYGDISNNWKSLVKIMTWFGDHQDELVKFAAPGQFNDPDMLIVGNSGLTVEQARVQMAIWSILAAPLIMSVDLSTIKPEFKEILLNKEVIAVDQDKLGRQGLRVWMDKDNKTQIWHRKLSGGARAIAFLNLRESEEVETSFNRDQTKLPLQEYVVKDLYKEEPDRSLSACDDLNVKIKPTGVKFYKFIPK